MGLDRWYQLYHHKRMGNTRPISWIKAARKDFQKFPKEAQEIVLDALTIKTPQPEVEVIKARLKGLKEELS